MEKPGARAWTATLCPPLTVAGSLSWQACSPMKCTRFPLGEGRRARRRGQDPTASLRGAAAGPDSTVAWGRGWGAFGPRSRPEWKSQAKRKSSWACCFLPQKERELLCPLSLQPWS